ncbi:hypothetical protein Plhal703r1_c42g0142941 [Plasmopara halstedii]
MNLPCYRSLYADSFAKEVKIDIDVIRPRMQTGFLVKAMPPDCRASDVDVTTIAGAWSFMRLAMHNEAPTISRYKILGANTSSTTGFVSFELLSLACVRPCSFAYGTDLQVICLRTLAH